MDAAAVVDAAPKPKAEVGAVDVAVPNPPKAGGACEVAVLVPKPPNAGVGATAWVAGAPKADVVPPKEKFVPKAAAREKRDTRLIEGVTFCFNWIRCTLHVLFLRITKTKNKTGLCGLAWTVAVNR